MKMVKIHLSANSDAGVIKFATVCLVAKHKRGNEMLFILIEYIY